MRITIMTVVSTLAIAVAAPAVAADSYHCEFVVMRTECERAQPAPGIASFELTEGSNFDDGAQDALRDLFGNPDACSIEVETAPNVTLNEGEPATIEIATRLPILMSEDDGTPAFQYRDIGHEISVAVTPATDGRLRIHVKLRETRADEAGFENMTDPELHHPIISTSAREITCLVEPGQAVLLVGDANPAYAFRVTKSSDTDQT